MSGLLVSMKRRHWTVPAAIVSLLTAVGCAVPASSGPSSDGRQVVHVITGDGETLEISRVAEPRLDQNLVITQASAWTALPRAYEALGLQVDVWSDAERQLGSSRHRFSREILTRSASEFFDCGMDPGLNRPLADRASVEARIVSTVIPRADGSAGLRTEVSGVAWRTGGTGRAACRSTGLLEIVIARLVEERAG